MKKQPQITEQTRKNLIDSFYKLYKKKTNKKITVGSICNDASYYRTTFYRYFNNTSDILKELEDTVISNVKESLNKNSNSRKTNGITFEKFEEFTKEFGEYLVVFQNNGNYNFYNKFKKLIKSDVYDYFNLNIKNENDKDFVFEFVFSSLFSSYVYWYNHKDMVSLKTFTEYANNILAHGIEPILKNK